MDVHRSSKPTRRDRYSRPAPIRPVSLSARISVLQTEETGSTPVRGSNLPGCGSGPTDEPLKLRSRESARTFESCSRFQNSRRLGRRGALAHNEGQVGSTPIAATSHANLAQWESTAMWPPHEMVRFHQLVPNTGVAQCGRAAVSKTASAWVQSLPPVPNSWTFTCRQPDPRHRSTSLSHGRR